MLEIKRCCSVPFQEKLFEEYEVREDAIFANINASRVLDMMKCFAGMRDELMFFVLEFPCIFPRRQTKPFMIFLIPIRITVCICMKW